MGSIEEASVVTRTSVVGICADIETRMEFQQREKNGSNNCLLMSTNECHLTFIANILHIICIMYIYDYNMLNTLHVANFRWIGNLYDI